MDSNNFSQVLAQLQETNHAFLAQMLAQNQAILEDVISRNKSSLVIPSFRNFNSGTEQWSTYQFQLEQHMIASSVKCEDTKRSCFLSWVGSDVLELLQRLFDGKAEVQPYKELVTALEKHFGSQQHILAARFKFYNQTRMKENQKYVDWVADLRGVARECNFTCENEYCRQSYVDNKIRDMIVLYTPHKKVRTACLQKSNPSLEEVLQICSIFEATVKASDEIEDTKEPTNEVHAIQRYNVSESKSKGKLTFKNLQSCPGCGKSHQREECYHFKNRTRCNRCSKLGHISKVCQAQGKLGNSQQIHEMEVEESSISHVEAIDTVNNGKNDKLMITIKVNNEELPFQLDTGASCSLIGLDVYKKLKQPLCSPSNKTLKAYGGAMLALKGVVNVDVKVGNQTRNLQLYVVDLENVVNIFGFDWFKEFDFQIKSPYNNLVIENCLQVSNDSLTDLECRLKQVLNNFNEVFSEGLGHCPTFKADITLKSDAVPKFMKPYNIPFALHDKVRQEIDRLVSNGVIEPINSSEWASPIVVVPKPNGSIRVCADFKVTLNPQIKTERYPIPRIEELFHKLQGGRYFSKIDLSEAYLQIELSDAAKRIMVINTPFGLYQYKRMPFGIASAPAIFQRFMEETLADIPGCAIYLDDVIITGKTNSEHIQNLTNVLEKLKYHGLKCKTEKCEISKSLVEYVGHIIDCDGIRPSEKRLAAIQNMPRPSNIKELESFIGKINYYNKFIPNFSKTAAPLNELRKLNAKFVWTDLQETAFKTLRQDIVNATKLVHYDDKYPIILATDASNRGIGAVLSHRFPDGSEKPICFASKTLNASQVNYSQIEKEALAIIFGVTKFHQYLYGRHFELVTDHQALTTIFHPFKKLPIMTLHRLQRWAITLQAYEYSIKYKTTSHHANADALSRLPMGDDKEFDKTEAEVLYIDDVYNTILQDCPIDSETVALHTKSDETLKVITNYVKNGWPEENKSEASFNPYFARKYSISIEKDVLLLHNEHSRVIVPSSLRSKVLSMLHDGHWGACRMKQLARRYVWFPNIDQEIESMAKKCTICQENGDNPKQVFSAWPEAEQPWERIHIDFAGPFLNKMWLIAVDSYSKFPFVRPVSVATSGSTIAALQSFFAIEGLPRTIVTDNGTQFTSSEFKRFCEVNAIEHLTTAPFHPASNGLAERFVRTFKTAFTKISKEQPNQEQALYKYLVTYRSTPNPHTGKSPAELLHGRQPRTILTAMFPVKHELSKFSSKLSIGQKVYVRNFSGKKRWVEGEIKATMGNLMFTVKTAQGEVRRHQNQIKSRIETSGNNITKQCHVSKKTANDDIDILIPDNYSNMNPSVETSERHSTVIEQTNIASSCERLEPANQASGQTTIVEASQNMQSNGQGTSGKQNCQNSEMSRPCGKRRQQFTPRRSERIRKRFKGKAN